MLINPCIICGSVEAGKAYDATELVSSYSGPKVDLDKNGRKMMNNYFC